MCPESPGLAVMPDKQWHPLRNKARQLPVCLLAWDPGISAWADGFIVPFPLKIANRESSSVYQTLPGKLLRRKNARITLDTAATAARLRFSSSRLLKKAVALENDRRGRLPHDAESATYS